MAREAQRTTRLRAQDRAIDQRVAAERSPPKKHGGRCRAHPGPTRGQSRRSDSSEKSPAASTLGRSRAQAQPGTCIFTEGRTCIFRQGVPKARAGLPGGLAPVPLALAPGIASHTPASHRIRRGPWREQFLFEVHGPGRCKDGSGAVVKAPLPPGWLRAGCASHDRLAVASARSQRVELPTQRASHTGFVTDRRVT